MSYTNSEWEKVVSSTLIEMERMFGTLEKQYPPDSGVNALHLRNIESIMKIALRKLNRSVMNEEEELNGEEEIE